MADDTPRTLSDPQTLRALSHPVRLALLDALQEGPLTATQAGEAIGESPTTCSFHLRQLARYGFVEEAGGGRGRVRPWRLAHRGWTAPAQPGNPAFARAQQALDQVLLDRLLARIRRYVDTAPTYPAQWQAAATGHTSTLHVTAAEAAEMAAAYRRVTDEFRARWADRTDRPEGTLPVEVLFGVYPAT
ncbi:MULTISPECIES: winged helix-turn-helix domain-containing protein [Dactylosporangium]|uniref:Transcriptional regulator n=2 Tax=Dactylosporangium TaxID=35753 RepID=A0A9W6NR85_9ACTN|nr:MULTISPECIES: winged helix-turn-helix domain-containing protein [Dactylosporangium]UAB94195.1 winged helix-turn-helix transcriptional regulator [Dactylosporangium vinaceum]UWZ42604.1 winged helix-turn-helix transcriptional regulator [Dactylosporangium matsuzakiense]GLL06163.1 transcriptional regulator [Dactylosporangium matsuzakiense]